ncbi:MAG: hypothetical protein H6599_11475 [Flavobacteriales bacterium]|nr:hypothetical protein [Flavobacteriales bacterium]
MKSILFSLFLIVVSNASYGQLYNIRLGGNASLGGTLTTLTVANTQSDEDTSAVLASFMPINVDITPWKFLSFNAGFKIGSWLNEDPNDDNIIIKQKTTSAIMFGFKLYPLMKDNFNLYFGYDLGIGGFKTVKETSGVFFVSEVQKWKGINQNINFGMNWYFGGAFGMFFQTGYTGYNLNLKEFTWNNEDQMEAFDLSANMIVKGAQLELGFTYKIGGI